MDRERKLLMVIAALGPAIAFRLHGVAVWAFVLTTTAIAAGIAVWLLHRDELLKPVLAPKGLDLTWGVGTGGLMVFLLSWSFNRWVAPVDIAYGALRRCTTEGALFGLQSQLHSLGKFSEWVRDETCREYALTLGLTGPARGAAVLTAAVIEEIAWRGGVQQSLGERFGTGRGWLLATGLYALAHVPSGRPLVVILALVGGFVWGGLYRYRGRLAPSIMSHAVFGWLTFHASPLMSFTN